MQLLKRRAFEADPPASCFSGVDAATETLMERLGKESGSAWLRAALFGTFPRGVAIETHHNNEMLEATLSAMLAIAELKVTILGSLISAGGLPPKLASVVGLTTPAPETLLDERCRRLLQQAGDFDDALRGFGRVLLKEVGPEFSPKRKARREKRTLTGLPEALEKRYRSDLLETQVDDGRGGLIKGSPRDQWMASVASWSDRMNLAQIHLADLVLLAVAVRADQPAAKPADLRALKDRWSRVFSRYSARTEKRAST